uniref:Uncharacterized protein n=1 Tax=Panagrolaimus sp. ES5 TaxID=591445 RepID=A0AC34G0G9_9BILA
MDGLDHVHEEDASIFDDSNDPLYLSNITSKYLKLAIQFCQFFINSQPYIPILPYQASITNFGLTDSERFLLSLNLNEQTKL